VFKKWLCLSPDDGGGGGGGAGGSGERGGGGGAGGSGERAGDKLRARVKDFSEPAQALAAITESLAEVLDDVGERNKAIRTEVATELSGQREKIEAAMVLMKGRDEELLRSKIKGRVLSSFEPLSDNATVDELGRTYEGSADLTAFQESWDEFLVVRQFARAARSVNRADVVSPSRLAKLEEDVMSAKRSFVERSRALGLRTSMDTLTAGEGLEWSLTGFTANLWTKVLFASRVAPLFDSFTIPQRVGSYVWPVQTEDPTPYLAGQATDFTWMPTMNASLAGTANRTFSSKVFAVRVHLSREFEEDSVIPAASWITGRMAIALAQGKDKAIVSGDSSTTHQDADVCATTGTDVRCAFDGIRKMIQSGAKLKIVTDYPVLDICAFARLGAKMGVWSSNPEENAYIASPNAGWQMMVMDGVKTIQDYGTMATVVAGEIMKLNARPVIISPWVPDQNASGVVDSSAALNTKTAILMVNRRPALFGEKRGVTMDSFFNPFTQQLGIVATMRGDFKCLPLYSAAGNTCFGEIYNLTLW